MKLVCVLFSLVLKVYADDNNAIEKDVNVVPAGSGNLTFFGPQTLIKLFIFNAKRDTRFYLYTQKNPSEGQEIKLGEKSSLARSNFKASVPTKIVIHGYVNSQKSPLNKWIRQAYLSKGEYNYIAVDWSHGSFRLYPTARYAVDDVGAVVGSFIDFLYDAARVKPETLTVIGHSLGAHVAGFAGQSVKRGRIGRIYGLDPALPLFENSKPNERLSSDDALYVETMHTNSGVFGYPKPVGHASFYPNFGVYQDGCLLNLEIACSHMRAPKYFAESITSKKGFWAKSCASHDEIEDHKCIGPGQYVLMGGDPGFTNRTGVFYLPTNSTSPFARGLF